MKKIPHLAAVLVLMVYWPFLFFLTHIPALRLPQLQVYGRDVTLHFASYFILTLLFWLACYGKNLPNPKKWKTWLPLLIIAIYGALDEITQTLVNRQGDLIDWISDMSGAVLATLLFFGVRKTLYWLILYWPGMFILSHWPQKDSAFVQLPESWQQYQVAFSLAGYLILTLLWWRTAGGKPHFVFSWNLLVFTFCVLLSYALLDETIHFLMGRGFDRTDFLSGCAGIGVGVICSVLFARHHRVNDTGQL